MASVLINHPCVGSVWLVDARIVEEYVVGETWDSSDVGSPYLPDDYQGQPATMNFPVTCIRKDPDGLLIRQKGEKGND